MQETQNVCKKTDTGSFHPTRRISRRLLPSEEEGRTGEFQLVG